MHTHNVLNIALISAIATEYIVLNWITPTTPTFWQLVGINIPILLLAVFTLAAAADHLWRGIERSTSSPLSEPVARASAIAALIISTIVILLSLVGIMLIIMIAYYTFKMNVTQQ
jgi:hypothetical protein